MLMDDSVPHWGCLELDDVQYFVIEIKKIPPGYGEVDVNVYDNGTSLKCKMVAGHVAFEVFSKEPRGQRDMFSPSAHWFMIQVSSSALPYRWLEGVKTTYSKLQGLVRKTRGDRRL